MSPSAQGLWFISVNNRLILRERLKCQPSGLRLSQLVCRAAPPRSSPPHMLPGITQNEKPNQHDRLKSCANHGETGIGPATFRSRAGVSQTFTRVWIGLRERNRPDGQSTSRLLCGRKGEHRRTVSRYFGLLFCGKRSSANAAERCIGARRVPGNNH